MNGFCVTYLGMTKTIELGWYKGNRKHGNWMAIDTNDMSIKKSGWFLEDSYVCEMRDHHKFYHFTKEEVFIKLDIT